MNEFMRKIGLRLKEARENIGLTQKEVAEKIGLSQSYIALIEKGEREVSLSILFKFSELYRRPIDYFIRTTEKPILKLRAKPLLKEEKIEIIEFENWCRNYAELEEIMGERMEWIYIDIPENMKIRALRKDVEAIKKIAKLIRDELDVGSLPLKNLKDILDNLGFRVFNLPLKTLNISGAFLYSEELGPCILVNANNSEARQNFTLAHELVHYVFDRNEQTLIDRSKDLVPGKGIGKKYVINEIAAELLMPEEIILKGIKYIGGMRKITREFINILKDHLGVTYSALLYRLYKIGIIKRNEYYSLLLPKREFKLREIEFDPEKHLPRRYLNLAFRAYIEEKISIGELGEYLRKDIVWVKRWIRKEIEKLEEGENEEESNYG